jgi:hypothetical protein
VEKLSSKAAYGRHDVAQSELCVRKGSSGTLGNRTQRDPDSEQGEEEAFKSGDPLINLGVMKYLS